MFLHVRTAIFVFCAAVIPCSGVSVYFVGNSVTDAINYDGLQSLAQSKGKTHAWARQMIPGAPLGWLWDHPADGFMVTPYGYPSNAFPNYVWDAISLQPFDRHISGDGNDSIMASNFINLGRSKSPNCQWLIYQRWPRKNYPDSTTAAGWDRLWVQTFTGGWDNTNETRDFFIKLTTQLRKGWASLNKPICMVPVGEVMYELNQLCKVGQFGSYNKIWDVYSDGIHLTGTGSYIVAATYFAVLYKETPVGLSGSAFGVTDANLVNTINTTIWRVVNATPLAGVASTDVRHNGNTGARRTAASGTQTTAVYSIVGRRVGVSGNKANSLQVHTSAFGAQLLAPAH